LGRLKNLPYTAEYLESQLLKFRAAMVYGGMIYGPQDPIRDIGRARDLQEMSPACMGIKHYATGKFHDNLFQIG
jgi:hypothetical protein